MSSDIWMLLSSGSAAPPAHPSQDSSAARPAGGLPTGWGNDHEYRPDYHSAEQPGQHSHRSSAKPPAGELSMAWGVSLKWTTCPSKWKDDSQICATHQHAAPRMQAFATTLTTLREIPWRRILEHLLTTAATRMDIAFDAPKLLSAVVEAAGMSTLEDLASYLHDWRAVSERVRAVLDWQISAKEMCEQSRPGAYLADCMITELKVREQGSRSSVQYHAVGNGEYQIIAHEMGIAQECATNSSANNVGNQLECLCWVAFEEDRPEWIIALVWHALQLELTWCCRKKFKSSAAVTAATEADQLFFIRSDSHPAHETQAYWEERSHIPALTALEAGHFHIARGMIYEANVSPAGAVPKTKAASIGQSAEESAAPAPPPKAKLPDSAWLRIANDPWRAKGIALPWREDHPQRPPPRAEPSAPSSSSTAKPPPPDAATPPFLKPTPKTKSMQIGDSTLQTSRLDRARKACRGQSAEESAAPAPPPKAKLPDSAWLRIANDPWRAKGIALPWREDHPQRPPPRAEPSAPSSSSTAKPPPPDAATPPFLKPTPKTKSMQIGDSTLQTSRLDRARRACRLDRARLETRSTTARGTPVIPQEARALKAAGIPNTPPVVHPKPQPSQAASQVASAPASSATVIMPRESHSDTHPVHELESDSGEDSAMTEADNDEPRQSTARTAEAHFARGLQLECCSKPPDVELDESDLEDAKVPTSITSISRSTQAASQAESPSASSATVIMPRESDSDAHPVHEPESSARSSSQPPSHSDGHPVKSTLTTPLWDTFLENLQSASDEENGRDFANFIHHHCFREDHFFKDSRGQTVNTKIPLSAKMESLFQTAWHRRKLALERLRQNGVTINDETYELNDNDMKTLPQLRLPGRHFLIVCEWD